MLPDKERSPVGTVPGLWRASCQTGPSASVPASAFKASASGAGEKNAKARYGERADDLFLWDLSLTVPFIFREQFANRCSIRDCIPKWRICGSGGNWKTRLGFIPRDWSGGSSREQICASDHWGAIASLHPLCRFESGLPHHHRFNGRLAGGPADGAHAA